MLLLTHSSCKGKHSQASPKPHLVGAEDRHLIARGSQHLLSQRLGDLFDKEAAAAGVLDVSSVPRTCGWCSRSLCCLGTHIFLATSTATASSAAACCRRSLFRSQPYVPKTAWRDLTSWMPPNSLMSVLSVGVSVTLTLSSGSTTSYVCGYVATRMRECMRQGTHACRQAGRH